MHDLEKRVSRFDLEFQAEVARQFKSSRSENKEDRILEFYLPSQRKDVEKAMKKAEKHAIKMIKDAKALRGKTKNECERIKRYTERIAKSNSKHQKRSVPKESPVKRMLIDCMPKINTFSKFMSYIAVT